MTWAKTYVSYSSRVTEGEGKPLKYPIIFHTADVAVVTKVDLGAAVDFSRLILAGRLRTATSRRYARACQCLSFRLRPERGWRSI
jgi:Ni2+-binding GTPase involved in maturation of urease and hydrogenase